MNAGFDDTYWTRKPGKCCSKQPALPAAAGGGRRHFNILITTIIAT